jgi:hypothetical protein
LSLTASIVFVNSRKKGRKKTGMKGVQRGAVFQNDADSDQFLELGKLTT